MRVEGQSPPSDKAQMEREKLRLDLMKTQLEYELLEKKKSGREPVTWWQKMQHLVICVSLFVSVCTYRQNVATARRAEFLAARAMYDQGWVPGATELANHGARGVEALAAGVHPTPTDKEPAWPRMTLAALRELQGSNVRRTQRANDALIASRSLNREAIDEMLREIEKQQDPLTPEQAARLTNLACVQLALQAVVGGAKEDALWPETRQQIETYLLGSPKC